MDRRALLAVTLSVALLIAWHMLLGLVSPPPPATVPPPAAPSSPAGEQDGSAVGPTAPSPAGPRERQMPADAVAPAVSEPVEAGARREFIVETETYSVRFSNEGGRILSWRLLKYVDNLKAPLDLVPRDISLIEDYPLKITIQGDLAATKRLDGALYREEVRDAWSTDTWPGGGFRGRIVSLNYADGHGVVAAKRLALPAEGYVAQVEVEVGRDGEAAPFELTWAVGLPEPSDDETRVYFHAQGQGIVHIGGRTDRFPAASATGARSFVGATAGSGLLWGGLESTYFASLLLPAEPAKAAMTLAPVQPESAPGAEPPEPLLAARFAGSGVARFTALVGPKDYDLLTSLDRDLDLAIDFSRYSIIYALTKYLFLGLRWTNRFIGNYGVSIVLLTIVIRAGFFPLTYRSAITMRHNMKKMQKIQPRVKAIQERYKKMKKSMDTQRQMNDEIMAVYKKEGMNPMGSLGGCLPLLLQMPVFIAFYNLLSVTIELRGAPFVLWIRDLSRMDPYYVSPILMGISWMVQQWMTSSSIPDPVQRRMMGAMPIIFTFMMARMPSGLVIYWFVSNVIGLGQQFIINRQADRMSAPAG